MNPKVKNVGRCEDPPPSSPHHHHHHLPHHTPPQQQGWSQTQQQHHGEIQNNTSCEHEAPDGEKLLRRIITSHLITSHLSVSLSLSRRRVGWAAGTTRLKSDRRVTTAAAAAVPGASRVGVGTARAVSLIIIMGMEEEEGLALINMADNKALVL